ncbi:phosphatase PAP2 family protein [Dactylosporangium maewongense]|uniref:Phosphatase PAP2 family protein n=1 Tax=Dactylosporangium maewongense TaxID=634393 RepID=A0ABP4MEX9_9ACTN
MLRWVSRRATGTEHRFHGADGPRRPGALPEVVGLLVLLVVFTHLHAAAGTDAAAATSNAVALQSIERGLHLDVERGANHWLAGHLLLSHVAVYFYRLYYVAIAGVLLWVYLRHAAVYRHVRRTMVAMLLLILPVYWAVPLSPPRFALPGVVDVVALYDLFGDASTDTTNGQNHYSAMPSLHVGWSLWCAYAAWTALRPARPRVALLPWLFPLLMAATVLTTGNHYVLDIAGSVVLLLAAVAAALLWRRLAASRGGRPAAPDGGAPPAAPGGGVRPVTPDGGAPVVAGSGPSAGASPRVRRRWRPSARSLPGRRGWGGG